MFNLYAANLIHLKLVVRDQTQSKISLILVHWVSLMIDSMFKAKNLEMIGLSC